MKVIRSIRDMQTFSSSIRSDGKTIGFVPTMGALHEGHLSLVRRSKAENDVTVVSIYVNPAQFGPGEDFEKYPRESEGDISKLSVYDVDVLFTPDTYEMYPEGSSISVNVGSIGDILCGKTRKGHFNGVATVVVKLFSIVMPVNAYFGQKDFQQSVIIKKLVRELNLAIDIVICPTVRETDGLAMSSRNKYLFPEERKEAVFLNRALKHAEELILSKGVDDVSYVKSEAEMLLKSVRSTDVEYIEVLDPQDLDMVEKIKTPVIICIAVRIGNTRLIDNIIIEK